MIHKKKKGGAVSFEGKSKFEVGPMSGKKVG